jgi:hypothetical protein
VRSEYLRFGGLPAANEIDMEGTRNYLSALGYGRGELAQSRAAIATRKDQDFSDAGFEGRHCDFCFGPIIGSDYDLLKDGRDRCSRCSRTVLSTHEQFVDEYEQVRRNMEAAFEIRLDAPKEVRMANAREIQRRTNETFTPSAGVDPRVLGFVRNTSSGQELWIENGSPRMSAITTMAHELTHVWQNSNWNAEEIKKHYGKKNVLIVHEGMSIWAQIQYLLFTRENDFALWQHAFAMDRQDVYGIGYRIFLERFGLSFDGDVDQDSPFKHAMPL